MKHSFKKLAISSLAALQLFGVSSVFAQDKETITIWGSGSDNVKMAWEALADAFSETEAGHSYEIEIQWITSGTGAASLYDRLMAAYKAGEKDTDYDIIELNESDIQVYLEAAPDIFKELDYTAMPNTENLTVDLGEVATYMVPYRGTTVVLAYDTERVSDVPTSAEELYKWIKDNPGRFAYNTPGSGGAGGSFVLTTVYNLLPEEALASSDEKWMDEWEKGYDLLKELHPSMYQSGGRVTYPHKNQGTLDLLANQQVDMIPAWADMAISQITEGRLPETTAITQIDPAFTGGVVGLAAPSIGKDSQGVQEVLDFFVSDTAQEILLDQLAAIPLVDSSEFQSENAALLKGMDVSNFRGSTIGELQTKLYEKWDLEIGTLE